MEKLGKLFELISDGEVTNLIPDINRGGCGFFAERCYAFLQSIGVPAEIVVFEGEVNIKKIIARNEISRKGVAHVMIYLPHMDVYLDGEGLFRIDELDYWTYHSDPVKIPYELLKRWNEWDLDNGEELWNYMWDRDQIGIIDGIFVQLVEQVGEVQTVNS